MATNVEGLQYPSKKKKSKILRDPEFLESAISGALRSGLEAVDHPLATDDVKEATPYLAHSLSILKKLYSLPLDELTGDQLNDLLSPVQNVTRITDGINKNLNNSKSSSVIELKKLCASARSANEDLVRHASISLPYLTASAMDTSTISKAINAEIDRLQPQMASIKDAEKTAQDSVNKISDLVDKVQETAKAEAVGVHAEKYNDLSVAAGKAATRWLVGTVVLAAITLCMSMPIDMVYPASVAEKASEVPLYVTKLSSLLILLGITGWSGRNYRSLSHQETVYMQKATALRTYMALVSSTDDEQIKAALLLEVTRMIFSESDSGMIGGSSGANIQINDLHRVLTRVGSSGT